MQRVEQLRGPWALVQGLADLDHLDPLDGYAVALREATAELLDADVDPLEVTQAVASVNDALTTRLLQLAEARLGPEFDIRRFQDLYLRRSRLVGLGATTSGQGFLVWEVDKQCQVTGAMGFGIKRSPDGRFVGYWLGGTPRLPGAQSDVVGFAAYDTVTGTVRTREVPTDRGLAPEALAWSPDSRRRSISACACPNASESASRSTPSSTPPRTRTPR